MAEFKSDLDSGGVSLKWANLITVTFTLPAVSIKAGDWAGDTT